MYVLRADPFALRFAVNLSAVPALTTSGVAVYAAVRKPERLQPEEFQLRQQTLELLHAKGGRVVADHELLVEVIRPVGRPPPEKLP